MTQNVVKIVERVLRAGEGRIIKRLEGVAAQVNAIEEDFEKLTDAQLRAETDTFKARLADGETLEDLMPEAFAAVREAAKRTLGKRHFDVQIMGGAALHLGNVAEMKTGEGKTLVATLASYLNALSGQGVHVVTVNDYLAQYQSELMGRVHRALGLETGCILSSMTPDERRLEYAKDITYGTNNEFGFDYLRDNMAWNTDELVQRGHNFAIVDEVDSILIDEARTPLIISGPADQPTKWYLEFARIAALLTRGIAADPLRGIESEGDYEVDEKKKTIGILEDGIDLVEDQLGIDNLYASENTPLIGYLNNAIRAKELFKRDKDYVVMDGEVLIVDEHTGRILGGRRYNDGMHQAIEAKEGVEIKQENQTLATITLQNYFRLYDRLSGMTGTAMTEAAELHSIYHLGVVPIRTNQPMVRRDNADIVYTNEKAKFAAVVEDIDERHAKGQPVLVGTASVDKSELLSELLRRKGIAHEVLNAKHHEREASIVADAGRLGAVTVATNMAGRGTDIMLGGNSEFRAVAALKKRGLDPDEDPEVYEDAWNETLSGAEKSVAAEHEKVVALGGLYVLGTERHESRRIDNQLRGRSGRQGDPGESRFYLSYKDNLLRLFGDGRITRLATRAAGDAPIEHGLLTRAIESAQSQLEGRNFEIRKDVLKYDDVLNRQREVVYAERREILHGEDLHERIRQFITDVIGGYVDAETATGFAEEWDLERLWTALRGVYTPTLSAEQVVAAAGSRVRLTAGSLREEVLTDVHSAYDRRQQELGEPVIRELERRVLLSVTDTKWREHLYEMDYLKEGIGLRAMAQRDPLVEYQREGYLLFNAMSEAIKEETVHHLFTTEIEMESTPVVGDAPVSVGELLGSSGDQTPAGEPEAAPAFHARGIAEGGQRQLHLTAPSETGEIIERDVLDGKLSDSEPVTRAERRAAQRAQRRKGR